MTNSENNQLNNETNDYWWANVCHISSIAGYIIVANLSFTHIFNFKFAFSFWHSITTNLINLLLPIIIWKHKKSLSDFVNQQGKSVINFQLFLLGYRSLF
ncbi:hypothetical protein H1P_10023 [Hyella patelloides LEGE 07179]|uniref:Uncharacterized protein n=1 Tax=Hyella patelloides LEGE 07179 TaxID=945734 RepID=A0A563VII8_9CYAN|nr:hypothetical protein H1P_10023 [Hyella patelloides LEGE 07179]